MIKRDWDQVKEIHGKDVKGERGTTGDVVGESIVDCFWKLGVYYSE